MTLKNEEIKSNLAKPPFYLKFTGKACTRLTILILYSIMVRLEVKMSYEGRVQILCVQGHSDELEDNTPVDVDIKMWRCECGSECIWWNNIDDTNCEPYPENGEIRLNEIESAKFCDCPTCGDTHVTELARFRIPPNDQGHHVPR